MLLRLSILLLSLMLVGCSQESNINDLEAFVEDTFRDHTPVIDPLPTLQPQAIFIYTASGLPDPFDVENLNEKVDELPLQSGEQGPDRTRRKEHLEAFPVDSLKLVGVLEQKGEKWAVIRAPDRSVHRVKKGNYMGVNDGVIRAVNDNMVDVSELIRNPVGRWEREDVNLFLVE